MEKKTYFGEEEERLRIQSERLKRQKEQLMMNAKIAANDARLSVLNPSAVGSSKKASDDSKRKKSHSLNPDSQVNLPGNPTQVAIALYNYTHSCRNTGWHSCCSKIIQSLVPNYKSILYNLLFIRQTDEVQGICITSCSNRQT